MDTAATLQYVRGWPVADQLELVFRLWDQLAEDGWEPLPTEDLAAELDRRMAAHDADPSNVRTWEQIVARARKPA